MELLSGWCSPNHVALMFSFNFTSRLVVNWAFQFWPSTAPFRART
jgi:hypothetical protein